MKTLIGLIVATFVISTTVFADTTDTKAEGSSEKTTSVNPLTGTKTTTRKYKNKHKDAAGKSDAVVTEKTKEYTNGGSSTSKQESSSSKPQ